MEEIRNAQLTLMNVKATGPPAVWTLSYPASMFREPSTVAPAQQVRLNLLCQQSAF